MGMQRSFMVMLGAFMISLTSSIHADEREKHTNYAAGIVSDGIDAYAITEEGARKLKGSPFVPNPVPLFSRSETQPTPGVIVIPPNKKKLFAVYFAGNIFGIPDTVWSFKFTPRGLEQETSITIGADGFGEHGPKTVGFGATDHYFFYSTTPGFPTNTFVWYLFETPDEKIKPVGEIQVAVQGPAGGLPARSFVLLDDTEHFAYVCTPSAPQISVYSLEESTLKFGFTSNDSGFVAAKCVLPSNN